jgi:hypothetical protein
VLIMQTILYNFFVDVPRAVAIWSALILLAVVAMTVMIAVPRRRRTVEDLEMEIPEAARRREVLTVRAKESARFAEEVTVAASRAADTARRRREEWLAAQDEVEKTWQAYDSADADARRMTRAAALPTPSTPRTPAEYADRERYLHRAAMAACCRRELPVLELSDVLAHRNGWDPRRHPVEQEVILRRAVRDRLLTAHRQAAERERAAWQAAELAATAARSLRQEAYAATARVHRLRPWLAPESVPDQPTVDVARLAQPAIRWRAARAG